MIYFFILGHTPALSIAEILTVLKNKIKKILAVSPEALILCLDKVDPEKLEEKFGGVIKIGEIFKIFEERDFFKLSLDFWLKNLPLEKKKIYFGFSIYELENKIPPEFIRFIFDLGLRIKKKLKEKNISSRFVTSQKRALSSLIVRKNHLLERGQEFIILKNKKVFLGKTLVTQKFEDYEFRDFARPCRPIEKGMLPPKVAKIMINLVDLPPEAVILDPFSGAGTILGEAMILGYQNLIGSDLSAEALKRTKRNLDWLSKSYNLKKVNLKIFLSPAEKLSQKLAPLIDGIVTEPYLGPLKWKEKEIEKIIKNLIKFYAAFLPEFKKILRPRGKIVIIFPFFQGKETHPLLLQEQIKKNGFKIKELFPQEIKEKKFFSLGPNKGILYGRPQQKIWREILVLEKEV